MRKPSAPCTLAQISGTPWCSKEHTSQTQSVPGVLCALYLCQGLLLHLSLMKVYHPAIMIVAGAFLSLVQVLSTTFPKWIVNFCSYLWILTFFSSQIYIQFQFARHFFKQNYFLCSACIGLSLLPVARFQSVPRFISCLSYLLPADNQSVDPVSCQRPANR